MDNLCNRYSMEMWFINAILISVRNTFKMSRQDGKLPICCEVRMLGSESKKLFDWF